jgi:hypothetical protein
MAFLILRALIVHLDAFTDNYIDSDPRELDTTWLFSTVKEWAADRAQ